MRHAQYNVVWNSPSPDITGTMPIGNGTLAANVWMRPEGTLELLLAGPDAVDINGILLKLGRLRIILDPPPRLDARFTQTLLLDEGCIVIDFAGDVTIRIQVEAREPLLRVGVQSNVPRRIRVDRDMWRDVPRTIKTQTGDILKNLEGPDPHPTIIDADVVFDSFVDRLVWCHHNAARTDDPFAINMKLQGLGDFIPQMPHPLAGQAFGCVVMGAGLVGQGGGLVSESTQACGAVWVYAHCALASQPEQWAAEAQAQCDAAIERAGEQAKGDRWSVFWNRSYVQISSPDPIENGYAKTVSRAYALSRFMTACAGGGPIKHNGSLFSVGRGDDADFRRWGAGYWFQNQRLIYWPTLAAGDVELVLPWFEMLRLQLPLQMHRTKTYYGHAGAHFPETTFAWGAEISGHYGWTPFTDRAAPHAECAYVSHYYSGGIELSVMMLECFEITADAAFARDVLMPIAREVIAFYDAHYAVGGDGKRKFTPCGSLETWHVATNPLPEIAGLRFLLPRLMELPATLVNEADRERWQNLLASLPGVPTRDSPWGTILAPAAEFSVKLNTENPELYAVFPYRLFGVDQPDLDLARRTFAARLHASHACWSQDDIQLALLGLADQAKANVIQRAGAKCHSDSRFPAFWNSFNDWTPDVDHGGVLQLALQYMLMQTRGRAIHLLPAWPGEWDVDFKLHAPHRTTVQASVRGGKLTQLLVDPPERFADVDVDPRWR